MAACTLRSLLEGARPVTLIAEPALVAPLAAFAKPLSAARAGADALTVHSLADTLDLAEDASSNIYCYVLRSLLASVHMLARHMDAQPSKLRQYFVFFCPCASHLCSHLVQDYFDRICTHAHIASTRALGFTSLAQDLFSLDLALPCGLGLHSADQQSALEAVAQTLALHAQQMGSGRRFLGQVLCGGKLAAKCAESFLSAYLSPPQTREEPPAHTQADDQREGFHQIVILERALDLMSVLVTPLTYEGLLDDAVGVVGGTARFEDGAPLELRCSEDDSLYAELRDLPFELVGPALQRRAREVKRRYDSFREDRDASLDDIHRFVKRIPLLTSEYRHLDTHVSVTERLSARLGGRRSRECWQRERALLDDEFAEVLEFIGDAAGSDVDGSEASSLLRLLCLHSLAGGGVGAAAYGEAFRLLTLAYGPRIAPAFAALESAGLLRRGEELMHAPLGVKVPRPIRALAPPVWHQNKRAFRLLLDTGAPLGEADARVAGVSAGYVPLAYRLLERAFPSEFKHMEISAEKALESARQLSPLPLTAISVKDWLRNTKSVNTYSLSQPKFVVDGSCKKVMAVVMLNGITYTEVAALRLLSRREDFPFTIVMFTTHTTNGNKILQEILG